jgi:hypothetical protein
MLLGLIVCVAAAFIAETIALAQDAKPPAKQQPVANAKLKEWLPGEMAGLKRSGANSSDLSMGDASYSMASGHYGDHAAGTMGSLSVTDYAASPEQGAGMSTFRDQPMNHEMPGGGYQRTTTVEGYPAMEMYDPQTKMGMLTVYVGDRFFVQASTTGVDKDAFQKSKDSLGLKKLAELAGGGPATAPATRPAGAGGAGK